jgi:hypothetical protein
MPSASHGQRSGGGPAWAARDTYQVLQDRLLEVCLWLSMLFVMTSRSMHGDKKKRNPHNKVSPCLAPSFCSDTTPPLVLRNVNMSLHIAKENSMQGCIWAYQTLLSQAEFQVTNTKMKIVIFPSKLRSASLKKTPSLWCSQ